MQWSKYLAAFQALFVLTSFKLFLAYKTCSNQYF